MPVSCKTVKPFQAEDEFTKIHNYALEVFMPLLPANAWKILCFILRETKGWHTDHTQVAYKAIKAGTGIASDETVARNLKILLGQSSHPKFAGLNLLIKSTEGRWDSATYRLNLDYEAEVQSYDNRSRACYRNRSGHSTKIEVRPYIQINNKEKHIASEKQTRKQMRRGPFSSVVVGKGILCPEDFSPSGEMRAWAQRTLPPATLTRLDSLTEQFVRKHRQIKRDYLLDMGAWEACWQNFMQACGDNDRARGTQGGHAQVEEGPSFDELVAGGFLSLDEPQQRSPPMNFTDKDKSPLPF
jgi:hypothetical protein